MRGQTRLTQANVRTLLRTRTPYASLAVGGASLCSAWCVARHSLGGWERRHLTPAGVRRQRSIAPCGGMRMTFRGHQGTASTLSPRVRFIHRTTDSVVFHRYFSERQASVRSLLFSALHLCTLEKELPPGEQSTRPTPPLSRERDLSPLGFEAFNAAGTVCKKTRPTHQQGRPPSRFRWALLTPLGERGDKRLCFFPLPLTYVVTDNWAPPLCGG